MPKSKYKIHTVNLPYRLSQKIMEAVESERHGFTSVPDFVREAVRRYLRELSYIV